MAWSVTAVYIIGLLTDLESCGSVRVCVSVCVRVSAVQLNS